MKEYINISFNDYVLEQNLFFDFNIYLLESEDKENKDKKLYLNEVTDCVYVINLAKRKDRLKDFQKVADTYNLSYTKLTGIDGEKLPKNQIEEVASRMGGRRMKSYHGEPYNFAKARGVVGCAMSHMKCVEDAKEKGYKHVCILEDDTHLQDSFDEHFRLAWNSLPKNFDIFYFWMGGKDKDTNIYKEKAVDDNITQVLKGGFGLVGYIVNVNRMHDFYHSDKFEMGVIDRILPIQFHPQEKCYYMNKKCITFKEDFSDIEKVVIK